MARHAQFLTGLGVGLVLTSLVALGNSPGKSIPDQAEIERLARNLGMAYREEVVIFPELSQEASGNQETPAGEKPGSEDGLIQITIPPGSTSQQIASILVEEGLIRDRGSFERLVRERGVSTRLEAGQYELSPTWSLDKIIDILLIKGRR
ncbi:MAG TPA: endolytic transglycosylase MltG [Clostridia bacterium]|nr:endolytic transglycosylase MltG [Clostridia bacterium]